MMPWYMHIVLRESLYISEDTREEIGCATDSQCPLVRKDTGGHVSLSLHAAVRHGIHPRRGTFKINLLAIDMVIYTNSCPTYNSNSLSGRGAW